MAYKWCSALLKHHQSSEDRDTLLLHSLEIGFRHFGPDLSSSNLCLVHAYNQGLVDILVKSNDSEAIADLLHAWTGGFRPHPLLGTCAEHLVGLHNRVAFSPRLHQIVIRSVELIGYEGFERVGMERFCQLLDHLYVTVGHADEKRGCIRLLLGCLQSPEGIRHLSYRCWELLAGLATSESWDSPRWGTLKPTYNHQIMVSLIEAQEWDRLECWIASVWMIWPPGNVTMEEDLKHPTLLLFHHRPDAVRKLTLWMERWGENHHEEVQDSFKRICQQACEGLQKELK